MQVADFGDNLCKGKSFVNIEKLSFLVHYLSQGKHVNKGWMEAKPPQSILVPYLSISTRELSVEASKSFL